MDSRRPAGLRSDSTWETWLKFIEDNKEALLRNNLDISCPTYSIVIFGRSWDENPGLKLELIFKMSLVNQLISGWWSISEEACEVTGKFLAGGATCPTCGQWKEGVGLRWLRHYDNSYVVPPKWW